MMTDGMSNSKRVASETHKTSDLARSLLGTRAYIIVRGAVGKFTDGFEVEIGVVGPKGRYIPIVKENSHGGARMALEQHVKDAGRLAE